MNVRLLFFSVLKDITGTAELDWQTRVGATVADLLEELYARWPGLREWDESLLIAINLAYVRRGEIIPSNAEVALMPPVQGG